MKKHFLLLLMAFFSLAGWAEDLTNNEGVVVAVANIEYGTGAFADNEIRVTLDGGTIENTFWDVDGVYTTKDDESTKIDVANLATLSVGDVRYLKVKFKGVYSGYAYGEFAVTPATITVNVKTDAHFTMVYGTAVANKPAIGAADVSATLHNEAITVGDYFDIDATALANYSWTGTDVSATGYPITFSGISLKAAKAGNYIVKKADRKMKITAREIKTGEGQAFTIAIKDGTYDATDKFTYTAAEQKPTYEVKWDNDNNAATAAISLDEGTDFEVKYYVGATEVESPIDAGNYTVKVFGKGNFTTALTESENPVQQGVAADGFQIKQASLTVMAIAQTKVYDGAAFNIADEGNNTQFSIAGLVASETVTGLVAEVAAGGEALSANVGNYSITVNSEAAKIGQVSLGKNYAITPIPAIWKITARPVNLTVGNITMTHGDEFPNLTTYVFPEGESKITVEPAQYDEGVLTNKRGALAADVATITAAYSLAYANAENEALNGVIATGVDANIKVQTYQNAIKANKEGEGDLSNYNITVTNGNLIVRGANFNIMPVVQNKIEYSDAYTIDYYAYAGDQEVEIDEDELIFVIGTTEYAYKNKATWVLPKELGNYTVKIKKGTAVGKGNNANSTATLAQGAYSIIQKTIKPIITAQTIHAGDPETVIGNGVTWVEGKAPKAGEELALNYSLTEGKVTVEGGKITGFAAGSGADDGALACIEVALVADNAVNANYIIDATYTPGVLTISDEYELTLGGETTADDIAAAETNGSENVTVTFEEGAISLKANEWYPCVLPFNTTPAEFVSVFGNYFVFNRLSSTSTASHVAFALEMNELPAGEAFLIKSANDIDFGEIVPAQAAVLYVEGDVIPEGKNVGDVKTPAIPAHPRYFFAEKKIKKDIIAESKGGNKFVGVYATTPVQSTDAQKISWLGNSTLKKADGSARENKWYEPYSAAKDIAPLEAYLMYAPGVSQAPVITVEDFDGTKTAIKAISAGEFREVNAEGWYNLGGMKLQGAPTQKGVYIQNGKKVVIR